MARCEGVVLVVEDHPLVRIGVLEVIIERDSRPLRRATQLTRFESSRLVQISTSRYPHSVHGRGNARDDGWA
jgi:hypothetical protein